MDLIRQYPSSDVSGSPESMTKKFDIHLSSLLTYLDDLLESGLDSDLKILCTMGGETKEINVHKLILSRIPHFKIMLEGKFAESQENQIIISDFEYDVIKEMIRYIYTTNVDNIRNLANKLLVAAEKVMICNIICLTSILSKQIYFYSFLYKVWHRSIKNQVRTSP